MKRLSLWLLVVVPLKFTLAAAPHPYTCRFQTGTHNVSFNVHALKTTKMEIDGYELTVMNDDKCPVLRLKDLRSRVEVSTGSGNVNEYLWLSLNIGDEYSNLH